MEEKESVTALESYRKLKKEYPDAIVLMRVNDFYETFGDDAKAASEILGTTLTKRKTDKEGDYWLTGFPHHALDSYLPKLIRVGRRVAIRELIQGKPTEVVTPGKIEPEKWSREWFVSEVKNRYGFDADKSGWGWNRLDSQEKCYAIETELQERFDDFKGKYSSMLNFYFECIYKSEQHWGEKQELADLYDEWALRVAGYIFISPDFTAEQKQEFNEMIEK